MDKLLLQRHTQTAIMFLINENEDDERNYNAKKKLKRKRSCWVAPLIQKRKNMGTDTLIKELKIDEANRFQKYHRLNMVQFDDLLSMVAVHITKSHFIREPIHPELRLRITLRYLATGESRQSSEFQHLVGRTTIGIIIKETCEAIWMVLKDRYFKPNTAEQWKSIATEFDSRWNFPNCVGAIDGKHVQIKAPKNSGSEYFNYKGTHSIVLLAVCDAQYRFTYCDIGAAGRQSDGGIFGHSSIGKALRDGNLGLPPPRDISDNHKDMPYTFVADEAFPLLENIMRPYPGRSSNTLNTTKRIFNYRLSRARLSIENSFGILAGVWRVYKSPIEGNLSTIENVVKATVCLHNFLRTDKNAATRIEMDNMSLPNESCMTRFSTEINNHSRKSSAIRDSYANYFSTTGAVDFQLDKI